MSEYLLSDRVRSGTDIMQRIVGGQRSALIELSDEIVALEVKLEQMEGALKMVEWQPVHDPDTNELLGQLCLWCHRKPHTIHCERQKALAAI